MQQLTDIDRCLTSTVARCLIGGVTEQMLFHLRGPCRSATGHSGSYRQSVLMTPGCVGVPRWCRGARPHRLGLPDISPSAACAARKPEHAPNLSPAHPFLEGHAPREMCDGGGHREDNDVPESCPQRSWRSPRLFTSCPNIARKLLREPHSGQFRRVLAELGQCLPMWARCGPNLSKLGQPESILATVSLSGPKSRLMLAGLGPNLARIDRV